MYDNHISRSNQNMSSPPTNMEQPDSDVVDIRELLLVLWRRRWIILNTTIFVTILTALITFQLTPRFMASGLLAIETRKNQVVDLEAVVSGLGTDQAAIKTEIDVLSSRRLIGKLVDQLDLISDPEFNPVLDRRRSLISYLNPLSYLSPAWKDAILGKPEETRTPSEIAAAVRAGVIDAVVGSFSVSNPPRSYTLTVSFQSTDPKKAARVVNALAKLYLTDQLEVKFEATQRANEWLNERVYELREKVRLSEQAAQQFRERHQLVQAGSAGLVSDQQLAQINTQLVEARTDLARLSARQERIERNLAEGKIEESGLLEVLQSPLIQRLKEQESEVQRKRAELATRYGPKHPRMLNVEAELRDIKSKIGTEVSKIVVSIRNEAEVSAIRVETLEASLDNLKKESFAVSRAQVQMRELDREAEANRLLLQTFLTRFKETSSQDGMQQADARIISSADVPNNPSFPKKKLVLALAIFTGIGLGVAIAFLLEALDNGFRSLDQLRTSVNLQPLGMIPLLDKAALKMSRPEHYVLTKPNSAFAEAHRTLYTSLMFRGDAGRPPRVLAVTSSTPGEGKSTATLCLAYILGRTGLKVLVVEADMRRPVLKSRLDLSSDTYVSINDILNEAAVDSGKIVYTDGATGVQVLWSAHEENPQRCFTSPQFGRFIEQARKEFDLVLIDTPPVMAVSDAMIIAKHADSVMFVVQWGLTAKGLVKNAVKQLAATGIPIAGAIMTQVDVQRHRNYGYGDQGYYYGRDRGYYTK